MNVETDTVREYRIAKALRQARRAVGEDVENAAVVLRIRASYLQAIEDGRFEDLPGATYAVGFVRAYAEHLGLDGNEAVRQFKAETSGLNGSADLHFPSPELESGFPGGGVLLVGVLLAALAYAAWYVANDREGGLAELVSEVPDRLVSLVSSSDLDEPAVGAADDSRIEETARDTAAVPSEPASSTPAPEVRADDPEPAEPAPPAERTTAVEVTSIPPATAEPESQPVKRPDAQVAGTADAVSPVAQPSVTRTVAVAPPARRPEVTEDEAAADVTTAGEQRASVPPTPPVPPTAAGSRIELRATGESWIEIQDRRDGRILVSRLLRPGESIRVPDRPDLSLTTGNAGVLEIRVDGVSVPPLGGPGAVVRDVVLIPAQLRSGDRLAN